MFFVSVESIEEVDAPFLPPFIEKTKVAEIGADWTLPYIGQHWPLAALWNLPEPALSAVLKRRRALGLP